MITSNKEREWIIREAAAWAIKNYREELGEYLDASDEVLDEVELLLVVGESFREPTIWNKYDILIDDEDDEDSEESAENEGNEDGVATTTLVAAAWEWICPGCEKYQRVIEAGTSVECVKCGRVFETEIVE